MFSGIRKCIKKLHKTTKPPGWLQNDSTKSVWYYASAQKIWQKHSDILAILGSFACVCKDDASKQYYLYLHTPSVNQLFLFLLCLCFLMFTGLYQWTRSTFIRQSRANDVEGINSCLRKSECVQYTLTLLLVVVRAPTDLTISTRRGQWNDTFLPGVRLLFKRDAGTTRH